jgi:hypothetical protein
MQQLTRLTDVGGDARGDAGDARVARRTDDMGDIALAGQPP